MGGHIRFSSSTVLTQDTEVPSQNAMEGLGETFTPFHPNWSLLHFSWFFWREVLGYLFASVLGVLGRVLGLFVSLRIGDGFLFCMWFFICLGKL